MPHRRSLSFMIVAGIVGALLAGCSRAPAPLVDTRKADEVAIEAARDALVKATETKDIETCMSFYVDDPVLFLPGAPAVVDRGGLRKAFQELFATSSALKFETSGLITDVATSGDLAFQRASYVNRITDAKGKTTVETGKFALVWKKQGGSWKVAADTSASDK